MQRSTSFFVAVLVVAVWTCACSSPQQTADKLLEDAKSWSAAVGFAVERYRAGSVREPYVREVVARAAAETQRICARIRSLELDEPQRAAAAAECERMRQGIDSTMSAGLATTGP
jgi:hypothetical protein